MNERPSEQNSQWTTQRVRVDHAPPETGARWEEFPGRLLSQTTAILSRSESEERDGFYTLYETPHEGYKLYAQEAVTRGTDVKRPGQRASEVEATRALYSEEEAKEKYPEIFEMLLKRAQE